MSLVESFEKTLHRKHLERQLRFMQAAVHPKLKARPKVYAIPNTPYGVPKIDPAAPVKITETWVDRQKEIHKEPWFSIEDGPREFEQAEPARPKIEDIQREVCAHYGIKCHDLLSSRRTHDVCLPRQVSAYLAKRLTLKSFPEIGRRTGDRDHSTIMASVRRINLWLPGNPRLQASIEMLIDRLGGDPL